MKMAPLNAHRSTAESFVNVGLDFMGPYLVDVSEFDAPEKPEAQTGAGPETSVPLPQGQAQNTDVVLPTQVNPSGSKVVKKRGRPPSKASDKSKKTASKRGPGRPPKNPKPIKHGREKKLYVILFTCLSTRAVHLEYSFEMTTSSLINAIKRCFSKVGIARTLWSDNGTQLTAAAKDLRMLYKHLNVAQIQKCLLEMPERVNWCFSTPAASWQGGAFERLVGSTKKALNATMENHQVTYEEFRTLLGRAEAIINSRPLIACSEDVRDPTPVTPSHLTLGRSLVSLPDHHANFIPPDPKKPQEIRFQWRDRAKLANTFWDSFHKHYLTSLQEMSKWMVEGKAPKIGDVVLVKVDNQKNRFNWPLATIVEVYPSPKDGLVRVVGVRARDAILKRDIKALYRLEAMVD
jgi:hypothetical protein